MSVAQLGYMAELENILAIINYVRPADSIQGFGGKCLPELIRRNGIFTVVFPQ